MGAHLQKELANAHVVVVIVHGGPNVILRIDLNCTLQSGCLVNVPIVHWVAHMHHVFLFVALSCKNGMNEDEATHVSRFSSQLPCVGELFKQAFSALLLFKNVL